MVTTVVLSAWNGEEYIGEQLRSIRDQVRQADRVYIRDDGSSDGTVQLVREFIADNGLENWTLEEGENLGWMRSFRKLLEEAEGDIIFLCDQDDVWNADKIELMAGILERHEEIGLLCCGYTPLYMDDRSRINPAILRDLGTDGGLRPIPFNRRFMDVLRPGCCMAARRSLIEAVLPYWRDGVPHDATLWRFAVAMGKGYLLDQNLILWRRYSQSASNKLHGTRAEESAAAVRYRHTLQDCRARVEFYKGLLEYFQEHGYPSKEKEEMIRKNEAFERKYLEALEKKKAVKLCFAGTMNRSCVGSLKTVAADTLGIIGSKRG